MVEIARKAPQTKEKLLEVRGLDSRLGRKAIADILAAVKLGIDTPSEEYPRLERHVHGDSETDGVVDLMAAVVELRSHQNDVASQVLASHEDLVKLARGHRSSSRLMQGWRHELIGRELCDLLDGKLSLCLENGCIQVIERPACARCEQ